MNITPALFVARFPEFCTALPAVIQMHIDEADQMLDETRWGGLYDIGCGYYVANNLQLAANAAAAAKAGPPTLVAGGVVTSVKAGEVSYGLAATTTGSDAASTTTLYGQKFKDLAKQVGMGALAV